MTWGIPPPNPDPLLEAKYARPRSFKDMAGGLLLGLIAFVIVLAIAVLVVDLVR